MPDRVDARGYFWWGSEPTPNGQWAPSEMVPGHLRVESSGLIRLSLDTPLPRDEPGGRWAIAFEQELPQDVICGVLAGSNERIRLWQLIKDGSRMAAAGPSNESFIAHRCLLGPDVFLPDVEPLYHTLACPLADYEDWLSLKSISVDKAGDSITATYTRPPTRSWSVGKYTMTLDHHILGALGGSITRVSWSEAAELRIKDIPMGVEDAIELYGRIEDLLILLTDRERGLDFPILASDAPSRVRLYYARTERPEIPIDWHAAWVPFSSIADEFGQLMENWFSAHERFGPGFHLYLGNRRAMKAYPEFRFASFIWGLEAMHRRLRPPAENPKLKSKVERILKEIQKKKDRDWAAGKLPTTEEPPLSNRLSELFNNLPLGLDHQEVEHFAQRCTRRRNDVSHFGGSRDGLGYDEFVEDIVTLNRALDLLYHARILQQIGVGDDRLWWWFVEGFRSHHMNKTLASAGLTLPPSGTPRPF